MGNDHLWRYFVPSSEINYQLQQAIALAQSGQRDEARALLQQIVTYDPTIVAAWLWLATVAATEAERIYALQQVLNLDPKNEKARVALARLGVGETVEEEMFPFDSHAGGNASDDDMAATSSFLSPRELIVVVTILVVVAIFVSVLVFREVDGGNDATPTPRVTATSPPLPTALPTSTFTPTPTNTFPPPRTLPPANTPTSTLTPSITPTNTPTPEPLSGSVFGG
jgi:hypothetical protein